MPLPSDAGLGKLVAFAVGVVRRVGPGRPHRLADPRDLVDWIVGAGLRQGGFAPSG